MSTDLSTLVLGWISSFGSPVVALLLLLGGLGIPLPGTLIVIASGAFIRQDMLDGVSTPILGLVGTMTGDISLFSIGYFASTWIEKRLGHTASWKSAVDLFERRGGIAIFLTRWLLTAVAFPITLVAGSSRYRFHKYFLLALAGETLWVGLYGGLGYAFGSQWELVSDILSNFSGFALGAVGLGIGIYILIRYAKKKPKAEAAA